MVLLLAGFAEVACQLLQGLGLTGGMLWQQHAWQLGWQLVGLASASASP
jgi:hypothetical protein